MGRAYKTGLVAAFVMRLSPDEHKALFDLAIAKGVNSAQLVRVAINHLCDREGRERVFRHAAPDRRSAGRS